MLVVLLLLLLLLLLMSWRGLPGGIVVKNPSANGGDARDTGSIPGLERSPGVVSDNPL